MSAPLDPAFAPLVLVIEDELAVRRFLRAALPAAGYRVLEAETCAEGEMLCASQRPAVVLLDLGLPDGDGLALVGRIRAWSQVPVLVVSARGREADKVLALDAGADDYLTKPFGTEELFARMRVALRHAEARAGPPVEAELRHGPLVLDRPRHRLLRDGEEVRLTPTEWRLLELLMRHAGKVLTHRQILIEVWGSAGESQTHTLRVHMAELRKKLEPEPARPRWLLTEPGVGYRLAEDGR